MTSKPWERLRAFSTGIPGRSSCALGEGPRSWRAIGRCSSSMQTACPPARARMLFAGPPGTGKTLAAEVLASALGIDLLVVDISRLVSKWIGETEKNLAEVFDAAERAQAVLVFDEADALFGRRTEVSDAHD